MNPAPSPTLLLARNTVELSNKRHCPGGPAWGSPGEIKGQDNIHMSSFVMTGDRHKNTAQSCEPVSLQSVEQRAEVLQIRFMYMLSRRRHRPPPGSAFGQTLSTHVPSLPSVHQIARGTNIWAVRRESGAPGASEMQDRGGRVAHGAGIQHTSLVCSGGDSPRRSTPTNWREKGHHEPGSSSQEESEQQSVSRAGNPDKKLSRQGVKLQDGGAGERVGASATQEEGN